MVLFSLGWLAACGRSPEAAIQLEPKQANEPQVQTPVDERPVIAAFGDSLSAGFGVDPDLSYPSWLQKEIDQAGHSYRVTNLGISGDTTSGGLARIDTALALKPAIVILELGGNDGLRGIPIAVTRSNMERMIETLQVAGIQVVLAGMTLPPNYGSEYIRGFEAIYKGLAARYKLPLIPFLLSGVALQPGMMQRDGIHPTAEGNRVVAATAMKTLRPLLK